MELTWIAILASLLMGSGALLVFIWAVRGNHFRNFEDVKYQVFWSDVQDVVGNADPSLRAAKSTRPSARDDKH